MSCHAAFLCVLPPVWKRSQSGLQLLLCSCCTYFRLSSLAQGCGFRSEAVLEEAPGRQGKDLPFSLGSLPAPPASLDSLLGADSGF